MSENIVTEIVEQIIDEKPEKSKLIRKWIISISIVLISGAFIIGQYKIIQLNKIVNIEKTLKENTQATIELKQEMGAEFSKVNKRIDKVYDDAISTFGEYQDFNKKQLEFLIDYGQSNKDMIKKMLEMNSIEKSKQIENNIITFKKSESRYLDQISIIQGIDTTFKVTGTTMGYIKSIDTKKYKVGEITNNKKQQGLYDFSYSTK